MRFHSHYSSDSKQTTARKTLFNFLIKLGIRTAGHKGLTIHFAGMSIYKPGAYTVVNL